MILRTVSILFFAALAPLQAAEPIVGSWLLNHQTIGGENRLPSRPLLLRIKQTSDVFEFEYVLLMLQKQEISLSFASRLDGKPSDVRNLTGATIGTAKVSRAGPLTYLITLQGPNRPTSSGKMTISANGKTLTSESDADAQGGVKTHTVQVFDRQ